MHNKENINFNELIYLYKEHHNQKAHDLLILFFNDMFNNFLKKIIWKNQEYEADDLLYVFYELFNKCIKQFDYKKNNNFNYWIKQMFLWEIYNNHRKFNGKKQSSTHYVDSNILASLAIENFFIVEETKAYKDKQKIKISNQILKHIKKNYNDVFYQTIKLRMKDLTFKEISEKLNKDHITVRVNYSRSIRRLKKEIETNKKLFKISKEYNSL